MICRAVYQTRPPSVLCISVRVSGPPHICITQCQSLSSRGHSLISMTSLLVLLTLSPLTVSGLILKEVSVPPFIIAGERCVMECHYDSQVGLITYSVTIFKTSVTKSVTSC